MAARILTMSSTQRGAMRRSRNSPVPVAATLDERQPGPFLVWKNEVISLPQTSVAAGASDKEKRSLPAHETMAHARRLVTAVRAEIGRNPEFAAFVDRPASDIRPAARRRGAAVPFARILRILQAFVRSTR